MASPYVKLTQELLNWKVNTILNNWQVLTLISDQLQVIFKQNDMVIITL